MRIVAAAAAGPPPEPICSPPRGFEGPGIGDGGLDATAWTVPSEGASATTSVRGEAAGAAAPPTRGGAAWFVAPLAGGRGATEGVWAGMTCPDPRDPSKGRLFAVTGRQ